MVTIRIMGEVDRLRIRDYLGMERQEEGRRNYLTGFGMSGIREVQGWKGGI